MKPKLYPLVRTAILSTALAFVTGCGEDPSGTCVPGEDAGCAVPAGQGTVEGTISANRTFHAETTYVLRGYVKVASGATLTVEPGTRIVGDTLTPGSSLFVLRGARLVAEGTADRPIVFTSQRAAGSRKPGDWGGIVIVGNGIINRTGGTITTEGPTEASQNYAGGTDNNDSSGSLRYVRIEFAGFDVTGTGQELNSLSSYAVGRATRYEYIQSLAGLDDAFEWWGGAVDGRYLLSVESGDDHFDWSEGYQGRNQFVIAFQNQRLAPREGSGGNSGDPNAFEGDGCDPGVPGCTLTATGTSMPYSNPVFANFTVIGFPTIPISGQHNGFVIRRGSAGTFYNGIVARFKSTGLNIRDAFTDVQRQEGRLDIRNLLFAENLGSNFDPATSSFFGKESNFTGAGMRAHTGTAASLFVNLNPSTPNFTPAAGSPAATGASAVPGARVAGFTPGAWINTTYVGAADPSGANQWFQGWTSFATN